MPSFKTIPMKSHFKKNFFFYFLILALSGSTAFFYFYGEYKQSQLRDWVEDKRQEANFYASKAIDSASMQGLHLTVKTLSWAVRTELINENKEEINRYFRELSKDPLIKMAVLCDTSNRVVYTADLNQRAKSFQEFHDIELLKEKNIAVKPATTGKGFYLTAPIMGLNARYGTLFLHYVPSNKPVFEALPTFE